MTAQVALRGRGWQVAILAVLAGCARAPAQTVSLQSCAVPGANTPARCGTYEVWEDRVARQGRRITLNIVVLTRPGPDRREDPVFYLEGGPGGSATRNAPFIARLLEPVLQHRDLVFIDVRGTGQSHPLHCATPADTAPLQAYFDELFPEEYVRDCLARQDADVSWYTNPIAMDDLDEVRAALGYRQINLYGTSGGTRAAQVFMKRHAGSIRSVVLQGVVPMDGELPLGAPRAMEHGLTALFESCAADPACHAAFPDPAGDWARTRTRFDAGPVTARLADPRTGRRDSVRITRGVFADGVRHLMYGMTGASRLPALFRRTAQGDFSGFAEREFQSRLGFFRSLAYGALLSYTCSEDLRFISEADIRRETDATFLGDYRVRRQLAACALWPAGKGDGDDYQEPVRDRIPTLVISGDVDVATPARDGDKVARFLPRGRHIVFPNQSHAGANPECLARLIAEFFEAGDADRLALGCVAETRRPAFVIP